MATYTSYDVVGKKEDISDIITNISPTKTPFTSMVGSEKVHNTLFQWQEDSLAAPNLSNAQTDGFDATDATMVPTVMRSNYTQILQKTIKVAETTDAVARYGRAKETAYQLAKAMEEVKRDLESIYLNSQSAAAGSAGSARNMGSFQSMVASANLLKTGGSTTSMSEDNYLTILQTLYTAGADPSVTMIPPGEAKVIANYAAASGRYREIENGSSANKTIVNVVDIYVSPFGQQKIILNRWQVNTDYLLFDPAMWKRIQLRPWTRETLAKTGDATKIMIVGEFSLKHRNQTASGIVRKSA